MKHALCVALGLFAACVLPMDFTVDPDFTPEERAEIQAAADAWNAVTKRGKDITLDGGTWRLEQSEIDSGWSGLASERRLTVWIHPVHPGATVFQIALHEFGHTLRLRHPCAAPGVQGAVSNPRPCDPAVNFGVMDPIHVSNEITAADLDECRKVGSCE